MSKNVIALSQKEWGFHHFCYKRKVVKWHAVIILLQALVLSTFCVGQSPVQLAPPLLKYQSVFFKNEAIVELKFAQKGTQIHYTLNGKNTKGKDLIYSKPIQIKNSFTTVNAMVEGDGFLPSEMVSATFIKDGLEIQSVEYSPASVRFRGNGKNTLVDNEGGKTDLNSPTWLGYQQDSVELIVLMKKKEKLSSVLINCLQDHGSWVFLPGQIRLYYFDERSQAYQLIAEQVTPAKEIINGASCIPIIMKPSSKKILASKIKIIMRGIQSLPEAHPGKGQPGWLFIDEIKVY